MLSNEDKGSIVFVVVALSLVILLFGINRLIFSINPFYIGVIVMLIMYAWVIPRFLKMYYGMYDTEAPLLLYVPLIGESLLFSKKQNIAIYTTLGLAVLSFLCIKIPLEYITWIFGEDKVVYSSNYFLVASILFLLVSFIIRGISYNEVKRDLVDIRVHVILESSKPRFSDKLMSLLMYFPVVRCLSIAQLTDSIGILLSFHKDEVYEYLYSLNEEDEEDYEDEDE